MSFKESGKFIVSYSTYYSQIAYYIATVSDEIYMNPQGGVTWQGLCSQIMLYKKVMDKVGVEMQVFRHGQFKSAVEPYMCEHISPANRKQYSVLLHSIWGEICNSVSEARGISVEDLNIYADSLMASRSAKNAVDLKFVDGTKYYDEIISMLKSKSGFAGDDDDMLISL